MLQSVHLHWSVSVGCLHWSVRTGLFALGCVCLGFFALVRVVCCSASGIAYMLQSICSFASVCLHQSVSHWSVCIGLFALVGLYRFVCIGLARVLQFVRHRLYVASCLFALFGLRYSVCTGLFALICLYMFVRMVGLHWWRLVCCNLFVHLQWSVCIVLFALVCLPWFVWKGLFAFVSLASLVCCTLSV